MANSKKTLNFINSYENKYPLCKIILQNDQKQFFVLTGAESSCHNSGNNIEACTRCFGDSIAECVATAQRVPCQHVIACTGSVSPYGMVPDGNGGMGAGFGCDGVWVDGCDPPNVITPHVPGLCFDYSVAQPVSNPIPGAVTVGCFAGDWAHDIWRRCRDRYLDWVVEGGLIWDTTCEDIWNDPQGMSDWRYQTCRDLVRTCIDDTLAVCAANGIPIGGIN